MCIVLAVTMLAAATQALAMEAEAVAAAGLGLGTAAAGAFMTGRVRSSWSVGTCWAAAAMEGLAPMATLVAAAAVWAVLVAEFLTRAAVSAALLRPAARRSWCFSSLDQCDAAVGAALKTC